MRQRAASVAARRRVHAFAIALSVGVALTAVTESALATKSSLPPQVGYNYQQIETPRVAAMGDALRAFSNSTSALFVNPANMAASRVYHLSAFGQIWPEAHRQSYGAAAVDSIVSSAHVAGGLGGTWTSQDPDGLGRTSSDLRFALAFPFSDRFYVGLGGRYLWLKQNGTAGPFDPSPASGGLHGKNIVRGFTFDAGATLKPTDGLALSIVGQNLNNPGNGFQPMTFGGGAGFGTHDFTLEGDMLADFTTWDRTTIRAMGGFEFLAANHYPLRLGYRYDQGQKSHGISAGVGYIDKVFSAEVAVRRTVSGPKATTVVIGFTYHLESSGLTPSPTDSF